MSQKRPGPPPTGSPKPPPSKRRRVEANIEETAEPQGQASELQEAMQVGEEVVQQSGQGEMQLPREAGQESEQGEMQMAEESSSQSELQSVDDPGETVLPPPVPPHGQKRTLPRSRRSRESRRQRMQKPHSQRTQRPPKRQKISPRPGPSSAPDDATAEQLRSRGDNPMFRPHVPDDDDSSQSSEAPPQIQDTSTSDSEETTDDDEPIR